MHSVGVAVPKVDEPTWLQYQVTLKLYRYRHNGSVQSTTSYEIPDYRLHYNGAWDDGYSKCDAIIRWGP